MEKGRLEAFSDGVIAVIITIMVLEIKAPTGSDWQALQGLVPTFLSYVLSFVYVGIYWNNHHHMFHAVHKVDGRVMWANLFLLFWLSLVPFLTAWMAEHHHASLPVAFYGVSLLMAAIAYTLLTKALLRLHGQHSTLAKAIGDDRKGKLSLLMYITAIVAACYNPRISLALYIGVALIWLIPDPRIARVLHDHSDAR